MVDAPERIWTKVSQYGGIVGQGYSVKLPQEYLVDLTEYVRADLYEQAVKRAEENNDRMIDAMDECDKLARRARQVGENGDD